MAKESNLDTVLSQLANQLLNRSGASKADTKAAGAPPPVFKNQPPDKCAPRKPAWSLPGVPNPLKMPPKVEPGVLFKGDDEILDYVKRSWDQEVSKTSYENKLHFAFFRSGKYLKPEAAQRLYELFTPENIAITLAVLAVWAASHYVGIGFVIDVILIVATVVLTGVELAQVADALWEFFGMTEKATTYDELDKAAQKLAFVISKVGVDVIIALIVKGGKKIVKTKGAPKVGTETTPPTIKTVPLPPIPPKAKIPLVTKKDWSNPKAVSRAALKAGMTDGAAARVQRIAMQLRVRIRFRGAGGARHARLGDGLPKIEALKMNTINELDVKLGAPREGLFKVGYFKPTQPPPGSDARLVARYKTRVEMNELVKDDVAKMIAAGEIKVINGVVYDGKTGKPYVGDYDLYELTRPDGTRLNPNDQLYKDVIQRLEGETIDIQHTAHVDWKTKNLDEQIRKMQMIERHQTTDPIYEFREDGEIWEIFAE